MMSEKSSNIEKIFIYLQMSGERETMYVHSVCLSEWAIDQARLRSGTFVREM